ncbi:hypothetical protein [Nitrosopumilus sp.]|uniref:hypothetical protein n=1 Tax=Nitrosopumilus sp. TaxID=2024843 RepID=UPI00292CE043|nr:hypothetical protein [Nitrosopumilus sp.]
MKYFLRPNISIILLFTISLLVLQNSGTFDIAYGNHEDNFIAQNIWSRASSEGHLGEVICDSSQTDKCKIPYYIDSNITGISGSMSLTEINQEIQKATNTINSIWRYIGVVESAQTGVHDSKIYAKEIDIEQSGFYEYRAHCTIGVHPACLQEDEHLDYIEIQINSQGVSFDVDEICSPTFPDIALEYDLEKTTSHEMFHTVAFDHDNIDDTSIVFGGGYQCGANKGYVANPHDADEVRLKYPGLLPRDDIGVYQPSSSSVFQFRDLNTNTDTFFGWGTTAYVPLTGDWDGDGNEDIGLYFPAPTTDDDSIFFLKDMGPNPAADIVYVWGTADHVPIIGDWDGDGGDDVGLYLPGSTISFFFRSDVQDPIGIPYNPIAWGSSAYEPITGDWDGDLDDDLGLYQPLSSNSPFLLDFDENQVADIVYQWGTDSHVPITGDWDGDNDDDIGLYLPGSSGSVFFRTDLNPTQGSYDPIALGSLTDKPLTGHWKD